MEIGQAIDKLTEERLGKGLTESVCVLNESKKFSIVSQLHDVVAHMVFFYQVLLGLFSLRNLFFDESAVKGCLNYLRYVLVITL